MPALAAKKSMQVGMGAAKGAGGMVPTREIGAKDRPHLEHTAHVRHTGRVETQQLVESCRALPCQKERANAGREAVRA